MKCVNSYRKKSLKHANIPGKSVLFYILIALLVCDFVFFIIMQKFPTVLFWINAAYWDLGIIYVLRCLIVNKEWKTFRHQWFALLLFSIFLTASAIALQIL